MNNRARRLQYRKSLYRKKRNKAAIIASIIAIIVLFILFLVIGNALHDKVEQSEDRRNEQSSSTSDAAPEITLAEPKTVGAYALPLLEDRSSFSERLSALPSDTSAVCVALNKPDGTLLYRSSLSSTLTYLSSASDASNLGDMISRIESRELYVSAILYVPSFSEENELLRDVYLTSWCSVAIEAIRAGADDCLLIPRSASADNVDRICELARLIHEIDPEAIIGCTLPEDVISASNSAVLIDKLSKSFNYLALDTTSFKDDEDVAAHVEAKVAQMQMQLIYYKMRLLLPRAAEQTEQQKYTDIAKKYNISSWQVKP